MEWIVGNASGQYSHKVKVEDDTLGLRVTCQTCGALDVIVADNQMAHNIMGGHRDMLHAQATTSPIDMHTCWCGTPAIIKGRNAGFCIKHAVERDKAFDEHTRTHQCIGFVCAERTAIRNN
jgi:hypothetical protein